MKVFKFGGASIKDASAIRNMGHIIEKYGVMPLVIVVSAMGKTTRALEAFYDLLESGSATDDQARMIRAYHHDIMSALIEPDNPIFDRVDEYIKELLAVEMDIQVPLRTYDKVVSFGELISSAIIHAYLAETGLAVKLIHAPDIIDTSAHFGSGRVNWTTTQNNMERLVMPVLSKSMVLTQGYIGSAAGEIVTLGKEGSDFTAAIFASCLKAGSVTIWKDVPGVLSGDPKLVPDVRQVMKLPYKEASEMTYYGASVIHPKTIKPLALKSIPLIVRSFDNPDLDPTVIGDFADIMILPNVIFKVNQCLFSFRVKDYTFVDQRHLTKIFGALEEFNVPINMIQSSAISVSVCFDQDKLKIDQLHSGLAEHFTMHYNLDLELITIKNYDEEAIRKYMPKNRKILLEQKTRDNYRFLVEQVNQD
jgi:aspartate kinase